VSVAALALSQLLALALGAALVGLVVTRGQGHAATLAGYGFALGSIAITLLMRLWSAIGAEWKFVPLALAAAVLATIAGALARREWRRQPAPLRDTPAPRWARNLELAVWALIAVHVALALADAWLRPLFPWDAAAQWATKARVWFELGRVVPFVDEATFVAGGADLFTDVHPEYPATVPLFQVWAALARGSFDDAAMNVAWPLFLAALALGMYGALRRIGIGRLPASAAAYAAASLPMADVHAALAGYADLAIAVLYAFGFLALAVWVQERTWRNFVLLIACIAALPLLKLPGWAWLAALACGTASVWIPRRMQLTLAGIGAAVVLVVVVYAARFGPIIVFGYHIAPQSVRIGEALAGSFLFFGSWHLLGLLLPVALLVARRALFTPLLLPLTVTVGASVLILGIVIFFSSAADEGVGGYQTLNRAVLHLAPALIAYAAVALWAAWRLAVPQERARPRSRPDAVEMPTRACALCGAPARCVYRGHPGYQAPSRYDIYACAACDTSFAEPLAADDRVYDLVYRNIEHVRGYARYARYARTVAHRADALGYLAEEEDCYWAVAEFLATLPPSAGPIVEVGSGLGYLTYAISRRGYDVQGLDISSVAVADASKRFGALYECGDLQTVAAEREGRYAAVIMTEVIEHVPQVEPLVRAALRLVRPGGFVVVTTPNKSASAPHVLWDTDSPPVHLWWFSETSLRTLATRLGATVRFTDFTPFNRTHLNFVDDGEAMASPSVPPAFDESGDLLVRPMPLKVPVRRAFFAVHADKFRRLLQRRKAAAQAPTARRKTLCAILQRPV